MPRRLSAAAHLDHLNSVASEDPAASVAEEVTITLTRAAVDGVLADEAAAAGWVLMLA